MKYSYISTSMSFGCKTCGLMIPFGAADEMTCNNCETSHKIRYAQDEDGMAYMAVDKLKKYKWRKL